MPCNHDAWRPSEGGFAARAHFVELQQFKPDSREENLGKSSNRMRFFGMIAPAVTIITTYSDSLSARKRLLEGGPPRGYSFW
jgi:hypothetical protein